MGPNRQPRWQSHETVTEADQSLQEALAAHPFEGSAVVAALAKVIKATDTLRQSSNGKIKVTEASSFILERIVTAKTTAEEAPDPTYAQIFNAQEQGWEAAVRTSEATPAVPSQPADTGKSRMSDGKS